MNGRWNRPECTSAGLYYQDVCVFECDEGHEAAFGHHFTTTCLGNGSLSDNETVAECSREYNYTVVVKK